jgi:hypothetical protein
VATEKGLDNALATALGRDVLFLNWLVERTKFRGREIALLSCRSNHPWGSHPFPSIDPQTNQVTTSKRQSETDVLLLICDKSGSRLGIHIENKLGTGKFTNMQAEMYRHRAAHWIGNPKYGAYSEFDTVLLAPRAFAERHPSQAALFGAFISHEELVQFVPEFGNSTLKA